MNIKKYVLKNAFLHSGKSQINAIIPKLLGEDPSLKSKLKELMPKIQKVIDEVNKLSIEQQKKQLLKLDKHALDKKDETKFLPELKNINIGKCSFRLPPGPEKELHIGHALSYLLNDFYAKKYKGKLILRFDDTNPDKCKFEFVKGNKEDLKSLGIKWDSEYYVSDLIDDYYAKAIFLIKQKDAYVCSCDSETIKKNRVKRVRCECSKKDVNFNLREWNKMKYGIYPAGKCVLRLKGDMQSKNSVMWDPIIFRINHTKHYRQGSKYKVWPLYDFSTAIEDAKITHVLRDSNWKQRIELQDFIRAKLNIKKNPTNVLYSRYQITGAVTQGRVIRQLVTDKVVSGYDDIRLATVKGLLRRGILVETLFKLLVEVGITKSKTTISMDKIFSINRKILLNKTKNSFFIEDAVLINVKDKGEYYISLSDSKLKKVRLKGLFNIKIKNKLKTEYSGEELDNSFKIIPWIKKENAVQALVLEGLSLFNDKRELKPENTLIEHNGKITKEINQEEIGTIINFNYFGFCKKEKDKWIFCHK